jgi:hypothetical protein
MADNFLSRIKNYVFPTPDNPLSEVGAEWRKVSAVEKNLRGYITPVQLQRLRHDVQMWRDGIKEAEQAWYPHRVRMQRMYIDTILSGHTLACITRRKDLTLLRDFCFKNEAGEENEDLKKLFNKKWFTSFLEYALDAQFFGYTLVALGDMQNDNFPDLSIIRRFNISPDRLNVTSYVYSLSGVQFLEEPYVDWHVWIPTISDIGISKVGYGLLYNVAVYEILCRNILGYNADAAELYGMPTRVGTTSKTDEDERRSFESALANMGSAGYILKDAMDEIELIETKGNGQGFKIYADFEKRLEQKISKIILGHGDALDSVAGKLGATQGEESPAWQAMEDKMQKDAVFLEDVVNDILVQKLIAIGFKDAEKLLEYKFCFSNNAELQELRAFEDAQNLQTATVAKTMKDAGLEMDAAYFEERTGIKTTKIETPQPLTQFSEKIKNKLTKLYS